MGSKKSRNAANGKTQTTMPPFTTLERANAGVAEHTLNWEWAVHKGPANSYQYVTTEGDGMLTRIVKLGDCPIAGEFAILRESGMVVGASDQVETLYAEVKFNFSELLSHFDLSGDGRINFSDMNTYFRTNAYLHNAILAAERFVTQTGAVIGKAFGKDSAEVAQWNAQKNQLLETNLAFGYCMEERNHIQHVLKPLALINLEPWSLNGGLGVNLESDYVEYDRACMHKGYKRLREEFIRERMSQGRRPFLSIAGMLPSMQMAIMVLYFTVIDLFEDCLRSRVEAALEIGSKNESNGLLILPVDHGFPNYIEPRRILRWGSMESVDMLERRCKEIEEFIEGMSERIGSFRNPPAYKTLLF